VTQQLDPQFVQAFTWFRLQYPELVEDTDKFQRAQELDQQMQQRHPEWPYKRRLEWVGEKVRSEFRDGGDHRRAIAEKQRLRRTLGMPLDREELEVSPNDEVEVLSQRQYEHELSEDIASMARQRAGQDEGGQRMSEERRARIAEWEETQRRRRQMGA